MAEPEVPALLGNAGVFEERHDGAFGGKIVLNALLVCPANKQYPRRGYANGVAKSLGSVESRAAKHDEGGLEVIQTFVPLLTFGSGVVSEVETTVSLMPTVLLVPSAIPFMANQTSTEKTPRVGTITCDGAPDELN